MVAAHVVATVAAAVLLRVGGRWLVRMPECVRAIGLFVRRRAVWPLIALPVPTPTVVIPVVAFSPEVRNSRGPPR